MVGEILGKTNPFCKEMTLHRQFFDMGGGAKKHLLLGEQEARADSA